MVRNKPTQLERLRKEHYDKSYARQPQLMKRLIPLLNRSDIIERNTEPEIKSDLSSPSHPLKEKLKEPKLKKIKKDSRIKKVSDIRPDVLFGLSLR
ncbi:hypothetical protein LCGC14_1254710 [marine sediment metagenome]|uniref:Uncharacterized protein n=1 Tax=marine sediment metagenome TaxID=412755 RepID=A0A0F9P5Y1_9ZZZZ